MELRAIGGYSEVGKNMTAIKTGDDVILIDMGYHLHNLIQYTEEEEPARAYTTKELQQAHAIPDDTIIHDWKNNVRAIAFTHGHLDHIGAIPYLAKKYDAPILCTPYVKELITLTLKDNKQSIPNNIVIVKPGEKRHINKNITIEFIPITHSIPEATLLAIHTPEGIITYCNDFKLDDTPTLGNPPDYNRLKQLAREGVTAAIINHLYAHTQGSTPSENTARQDLINTFTTTPFGKGLIIATTFSSHIARLNTLTECSHKLHRQVTFMGRSMHKYLTAARNANIIDLTKNNKILRFPKQINRHLKTIRDHPEQHVIITTGNQGEPRAVLTKMTNHTYEDFSIQPGDHIIFSCTTIPVEINTQNRKQLEKTLTQQGAIIHKDIHASGHGSQDDIIQLIKLIQPHHLLPAHEPPKNIPPATIIATTLGFIPGETFHPLKTGNSIILHNNKIYKAPNAQHE